MFCINFNAIIINECKCIINEYDNYKWIKTINVILLNEKKTSISLKRFPIPKRNLTLAGNTACNFRFETTMRYGKTCKFEDSNIKETSCSRVIAWSVNDLSSLLRPEKKKKKRRRGRRKKVAVTALRELLGNSQ